MLVGGTAEVVLTVAADAVLRAADAAVADFTREAVPGVVTCAALGNARVAGWGRSAYLPLTATSAVAASISGAALAAADGRAKR